MGPEVLHSPAKPPSGGTQGAPLSPVSVSTTCGIISKAVPVPSPPGPDQADSKPRDPGSQTPCCSYPSRGHSLIGRCSAPCRPLPVAQPGLSPGLRGPPGAEAFVRPALPGAQAHRKRMHAASQPTFSLKGERPGDPSSDSWEGAGMCFPEGHGTWDAPPGGTRDLTRDEDSPLHRTWWPTRPESEFQRLRWPPRETRALSTRPDALCTVLTRSRVAVSGVFPICERREVAGKLRTTPWRETCKQRDGGTAGRSGPSSSAPASPRDTAHVANSPETYGKGGLNSIHLTSKRKRQGVMGRD